MPQPRIRLSHQECFVNHSHVRVLHQVLPSSELHSHEFFEIEIILSGTGTHIMNSKSYPLQRGMIWLSTPADFHEIVLDGDAEYWTIIFDETLLTQEQLQALFLSNNTCKIVSEDVLRRLDTIAQIIYEEHLCNGNLRPLMEYLLDAIIPQKPMLPAVNPVHQAILYTETFFRNNPSLATVAAHVSLSPNYFGNLFKKETGETYVSYLNRRKVTCAMMLLESGVSVSTACFESGFGSLSGFLQGFKKVTGISPNEYQKKRIAQKV
jgi:AraC-like DNA-binding protein